MAETRLHRAHRNRLAAIRARTLALVVGANTNDTAEFVDRVVPLVLASQTATVAETDAYMSMEAGLATGTSTEPWGLDAAALIGVHARRGDYLEDVYGRNHRATEGTFQGRMAREVTTDVTLADRAATYVHTEGDDRIAGYQRVTSGAPCALCAVAATRRYTRSDLQPIHHGCSCTVAPIYRDVDGWRKPDRTALNAIYERAGGTDYASLRRLTSNEETVEVITSVLGPTLVPA